MLRRIARAACRGALGLSLAAAAVAADAPAAFHLEQVVKLPGDEGWDYLHFEQGGHRLFIAHGTRVLVVDTDTLTVAGEVTGTPGVHGIALAPQAGHGYASAGRANAVVVFDLKTLARLKEIRTTGDGPDAITYDPATQRVFSFNGRGRNATAIDTATDTIAGTVRLDGRPESAVADGQGRIYVDLEDRNSVAVIDARRLAVVAVWPVAGCEEPAGLALDAAAGRLFPACGNRVMAVMDTHSGRVLGTAPICDGVDFAVYEPAAGLAFASCEDGSLTAVAHDAGGVPHVAATVPTQRGARTLALDERTQRLFLVTADFGPPPPATPAQPHPWPSIVPGTFRLLVVGRGGSAKQGGGT